MIQAIRKKRLLISPIHDKDIFMFTQKMRFPMTDRFLTTVLSLAFFLLIGLPFINHYQEVNHLEKTLSDDALAEKQKRLTEIEAILSNINYQQSLADISRTQSAVMSQQNTPFNLLEDKIARLRAKKVQLKQSLAEQEQQIEALIKQIEELKEKQPEPRSEPA